MHLPEGGGGRSADTLSAQGFYQTILETAGAGVCVIDREGRMLYVNARLAAMLGYAPDELVSRPFSDVYSLEDASSATARIERNFRGASEQFDFCLLGKDGDTVAVLVSSSPLRDEQGRITGVVCVFSDMTARRRAEETASRLAAIVESSQDAIIGKTLEGIIESWNPAAERMFGYQASEVIGKSVTLLAPPERASEEAHILQQLQRGERVEHFETERIRKDGRRIHVSMTISPIRGRDGRLIGASNVTRDITERALFEAELRQTQKLESLGVMAGGLAHDFNNLLVGIMGNADLGMGMLPPESPARQFLQRVLEASDRAANLTRQLLAYSGKGVFVIEPINLSIEIRKIAALLQTSIPKTVVLRLELDNELPNVEADVAQMQQLLMNLVINAAEAMEGRVGSVTVRTRSCIISAEDPARKLPPGPYVAVQVSDTGCGMDAETKTRIFEPFFTTKFTGRGLGLSAVQGIVRGHHGDIEVESTPGQGTQFTVRLPATAVMKPVSNSQTGIQLTGRGTVLVVDDEEIVRSTAKAGLEAYGYSVLLAENGLQGLEKLREPESGVSLMLLDLTMPVMGGEEVLRHVRAIFPSLPVILSSGFSEAEALRRFGGQNVAGFLQKPYTAERLAGKVNSVLTSAARRSA